MKKILELEQHVANLIAAGEVVERPASVVKELIENSIDAGAKVITVEITAGGMTYIRVTDNGSGIAPDDAETAFLRHATSKLQSAEGLGAIATLGFRGEALAAIAAVSRIEMLTRVQGAPEGISLSLEAGNVINRSPVGCPEGTTIIVRDLFYNTPARQKFVKTDRAESSAISTVVLRCALSRPDVSLRFIKDGKTEYHSPGDSRMDSCIYSLFGREFAKGLVPAESSTEYISVSGFVSAPAYPRGNRSYQFFFVNGRAIQSRTLQAALEQAYANILPSARFPSCVFYVNTDLSLVDVNVHPAKTEVKFLSDKQVFDEIYFAALNAIKDSDLSSFNNSKSDASHGISKIGFKSMDADAFRIAYASDSSRESRSPLSVCDDSLPTQVGSGFTADNLDFCGALSVFPGYNVQKDDFYVQTLNSDLQRPAAVFRVIGEALNTYIILEYEDSVWMIDKHAAHERIHFNALQSADYEPMPQTLIAPIICRHDHEDISILIENATLLEDLGFFVESFGENAVAVRQIPTEIDLSDVESVLSDICANLRQGSAPYAERLDEIYRAIACKASIKAGKSSNIRELEELAARVISGEVAVCPHGRPVAFEITKATLDKGFKRI